MAFAVIGNNNNPSYGIIPNKTDDGKFVYSVGFEDFVVMPVNYKVAQYVAAYGGSVPVFVGTAPSPGIVINLPASMTGSMLTVTVTDASGMMFSAVL